MALPFWGGLGWGHWIASLHYVSLAMTGLIIFFAKIQTVSYIHEQFTLL
jgi:hypothetical protein